MNTFKVILILLTLSMIIFLFTACEGPSVIFSDQLAHQNVDQEFLSKPSKDESYAYPIWGKMNFYNKRGVWQRGTILLSNGSKFSVETGDYIQQTPDHIDYQKRTITFYIDHFSRYAIGME